MKACAFLGIPFGGSNPAVLEAGIDSALAESAAMDSWLNHHASGPIPGAYKSYKSINNIFIGPHNQNGTYIGLCGTDVEMQGSWRTAADV